MARHRRSAEQSLVEATHVVVVGAGFAGLAAADELAGAGIRTTLVDARQYNTFQPLLYQVATGGLNAGDVAYPLRSLLRRRPTLDFRRGEVSSVDFEARRIAFTDDGSGDISASSVPYDYLVIATGATTNYFGVEGAEENARAIYTLDDALAVRKRVFAQLEHAEVHGADGGVLTVVVVGGGATGVEMAGALAELRTMALGRTYRSLEPSMSRVVLVERQDRLLTAFGDKSSSYALEELQRRGVEVRLMTAVEKVTGGTVRLRQLDSGAVEDLECGLVVWGAGVGPGSLVAGLGLETARGRIVVRDDLSVPGKAGVFAVGDVAAAGAGEPLPQLAQPAIQGGRHAARQIVRSLTGLSPERFDYRDKGIMATIGRHSAVAEVRSPLLGGHAIRLRGEVAWTAWLALHVVALLGGRNRAAVLLNWAWRYIAWKRGPRVIVGE